MPAVERRNRWYGTRSVSPVNITIKLKAYIQAQMLSTDVRHYFPIQANK